MELEEDQRDALRAGSKQVRRVAHLLCALNPESIGAAEIARQVCDQAWGCKAEEPSMEAVVRSFAGLLLFAPTLGPGAQEVMQSTLAGLIERLGLTSEVDRACLCLPLFPFI